MILHYKKKNLDIIWIYLTTFQLACCLANLLFLALLFLLKYAWKPILTAVEEREEGIKNALEADNAKKEMAALKADNERILREAKPKETAFSRSKR